MKKIITIAALAIGMMASAQTKTLLTFQTNNNKTYNLETNTISNTFIYGIGAGYKSELKHGYAYLNVGKTVNNTFAYAVRLGGYTGSANESLTKLYYGATAYLRFTENFNIAITQDNRNNTMFGIGITFN